MPTIPGWSGRGRGNARQRWKHQGWLHGRTSGARSRAGGSAETGVKRSCASLQRKNPKNTRTRSGTGAGAARAVAVRTDFLGALSHLVRVCGDDGVDGCVRGARGVRYRPSPGDGKPRIDSRNPSPGARNANASRLPGARGACDANGLEVAREGGTRAFRSRPGGRVPVPTLTCG